jgi:hypothetical protein
MANGSQAPVCPVSRDQAVSARLGSGPPPTPWVNSLPTAIAALKQIAQTLAQTTPLGPVTRPFGSVPASSGPNQDAGNGTVKLYYKQVNMNTEIVRVTNPDDDSNWVEVTRITDITFFDDASNSSVTWTIVP